MYTMDVRVSMADVDMDNEASLGAIIRYFTDCCTFQSEDLGIGVEYLTNLGIVWVLSHWQIDVIRYPLFAEKIKIYTVPYGIKGFMGHRNFFIEDEAGEIIVKANSLWSLISIDKGLPVQANDRILTAYEFGKKLDMEYGSRKVKVLEGGEKLDGIKVMPHHLDINKHVNNGQYVQIAQSLLPDDYKPYHLRAEYKGQARLGDIVIPYVCKADDKYVIVMNAEDGSIYASIEFTCEV